MIVVPDTCIWCGHVGIEVCDGSRCQQCGGGQPEKPGAPCYWCGKESGGNALDKPFCTDHYLEGMRYFFAESYRRKVEHKAKVEAILNG